MLDRTVIVCKGGVRIDGYVLHTSLSPDIFPGTLWARVRDLQNVYFNLRDCFPLRARRYLSETTREWHLGGSVRASAFGSGRDPGVLGSSPMSGSPHREPAPPSAYVSASPSLCLS